MGYACGPKGGFAIRVCSWCPGAVAAAKWAEPLPVTHGKCEACFQRDMSEMLGEKEISLDENTPDSQNSGIPEKATALSL
jgi:hypothetical protein